MDQNPHNKSITVPVLGTPNVGKSSFINKLLGFELTAVSPRAQMTRNKFHCVLNRDTTEVIFIDTPGLHHPKRELGRRMNEQAQEGSQMGDLTLVLFDLFRDFFGQWAEFKSQLDLNVLQGNVWIVFTKADLVEDQKTLESICEKIYAHLKEQIPGVNRYFISGIGSSDYDPEKILTEICKIAPSGPHHYPGGEVSNKSERFFASEYIREQLFEVLKEELPYEVCVLIESFEEFKRGTNKIVANISAVILVNRPGQRAIVVGSGGNVIKKVGIQAREKIEIMLGGKINLNLHVKVSKEWFKNNYVLKELDLPRSQFAYRAWRKKSE